ncbi:MAG: NADH:flavin oxidoreductase/NADH oxidase [Propionibacteriaceae bacterium]|jgi:2,4-dienoyl-CoA reductase-like NADH-dependent reductase (Old Yellow Enzyme family)|nr:NADH:flavin oxidoreductase/NADH oxidase [Propionibacteriaceae bacterium]
MLFDPLTLRDVTARNRVWIPPMCLFNVTARDGVPNDWHLVHYGSFATHGFGLIIMEATAVVPEGRISLQDLGLWDDAQIDGFRRVVDFCHGEGATMAVQLAHAGRKGSVWPELPGYPGGVHSVADGGFVPVGPTDVAFPGLADPHALTTEEVSRIPEAFAAAAQRADAAGIDVVEIHAAHGYLIHQFYSPITNTRSDGYGGDFEGRTRLLRETTEAVRRVWPESKPLFVRLSATDWTDDGWTGDDTVQLAAELGQLGVDLIDVSTGGNVNVPIDGGPGYQVPFAAEVRRETGMATAAVGLITEPGQAEQILRCGQADAVLIGREALRNPGWPIHAARALGDEAPLPPSYIRAAR